MDSKRIESAKAAFTTWLVVGCVFGMSMGFAEHTPFRPSDVLAGAILGLLMAVVAGLFRLAFPAKQTQTKPNQQPLP